MTESVRAFARTQIYAVRGYDEDRVSFVDDWPAEGVELTRNLVAAGFNFDDDGALAELGSSLTRRIYTIEFWVFGLTDTYARNLANVLKFALDVDGTIPLKDESGAEIDRLLVDGVTAHRQQAGGDPEPWQQFVWTTQVKIEDTYFASLV